jgi:DNA-binding transcriptional MerR regulator
MNAFTIKDLEQLSGIKAHTIRIWEQRYSFLRPKRTQTNIRSYSGDELKMVLNIALLNKYGYKISSIDKMAPEEMKGKILSLSEVQATQEQRVNDLITYMLDMNMEAFEAGIDEYISSVGIEKTINGLIFPYLERVGILWLANHIHPAQEHLVTNIIRQKLIMGIETVVAPAGIGKTALLFLPAGEYHELGLLFMQYLLKSRGIKVWYLGSNVTGSDLAYVAGIQRPDFIYTHLSTLPGHFSLEKFLTRLTSHTGTIPIVLSGRVTWHYKKKIPEQVYLKRSMAEVMEWVSSVINPKF